VAVFAVSADIRGVLSANGAGHPYNQGPGKGSTSSSNGSSGAGHGGRGSIGYLGLPGDIYGDPFVPVELGSGGSQAGTYGDYNQSGGGAIFLDIAGILNVDGTLSANGNNGTSRSSGGSGGSIWLKAVSVTGTGSLLADGGSAADLTRGSGGGGGRIAITSADNRFAGVIRAEGKPGVGIAYHGTYTFPSGPDQDLVIAHPIALPPGTNWLFRSLTIQPGVRFDIQSVPGTAGNAYADEVATRVRILENVVISTGAVLSADGLGYRYNEGLGGGSSHNDGCGGGAYGGRGGMGDGGLPGEIYGDPYAPDRLGSGGGGTGGTPGYGGNGGAALILDVGGTLTIHGVLSANGDKSNSRSGGGSGGSVWLKAGTLSGNGAILADGGTVYDVTRGGGGGGGRLALEVATNLFTGVLRARGQPGFRSRGRSGTFNFQPDATRDLAIAHDLALPPGTNWVFRSLLVSSGAIFHVQSVTGSAALAYSDEVASRVRVLGDMTIATNAVLAADGLGYRYTTGPGAGTVGNNGGAGGSYGGLGGAGGAGTVGVAYGNPLAPDRLGSGGAGNGNTPGWGGCCGGALILEAGGTITVEGLVSAHGESANVQRSGGGSGGSVWLKAPRIAGRGTIAAAGGDGTYESATTGGGGGAGGRILLMFGAVRGFAAGWAGAVESAVPPANLLFTGAVTAPGGAGFTAGADGTIRFLYMPPPGACIRFR
jgi:hypothetical protein